MKRSILLRGLTIGFLCGGLVGCQLEHRQTVRKSKQEDPTSWSDAAITRGDDDSGSAKGLPKSSRLSGAMSDEGADIERSLGVGR